MSAVDAVPVNAVKVGEAPAPALADPGDEEVTLGAVRTYRSKKEWKAVIPALVSVAMVVNGAIGTCPALPSLQAFCIVFGLLSMAGGLLPFLFRTEKEKAEGKKIHPAVEGAIGATGIATLGCGIWGAVVVLPNTQYFAGGDDCGSSIYVTGFIGSTIVLCVIVGLLGQLVLYLAGYKCEGGKMTRREAEPQPVADPESGASTTN